MASKLVLQGHQDLRLINIFKPSHHEYVIKSIHSMGSILDLYEDLKGFKQQTKTIRLHIPSANKGVQVEGLMSLRCQNLYLNHTCQGCGKHTDHFRIERNGRGYHLNAYAYDGIQMTCDHIIPKSKGGEDSLENFQLLCEICNSSRGNTPFELFKQSINIQNFQSQIILPINKYQSKVNLKRVQSRLDIKKNFEILQDSNEGMIISHNEIVSNYEGQRVLKYLVKKLHQGRLSAYGKLIGLDDPNITYQIN